MGVGGKERFGGKSGCIEDGTLEFGHGGKQIRRRNDGRVGWMWGRRGGVDVEAEMNGGCSEYWEIYS